MNGGKASFEGRGSGRVIQVSEKRQNCVIDKNDPMQMATDIPLVIVVLDSTNCTLSKYDELAADWQRAQEAPAVSVAVVRRGTLHHAGGYGAATIESTYQTASVGKQFTAALTLLLAEITSAIVSGGELRFSPGDAWEYSNAGYVFAGLLIGRHTGRFYGDLLRDRVFLPLGMTTAGVTEPDAPPSYCRDSGGLVRASSVSPTMNRLADGGLTLSVLDFARWEAALSADWGHRVDEMFTETSLNNDVGCGYSLSWFLSSTRRGRVAAHAGGWQGYSTAMVRYLDEGISAVVLANVEGADASGLAHALTILT
jgi:CubicO group peptidase (beta-lactamase class C family)